LPLFTKCLEGQFSDLHRPSNDGIMLIGGKGCPAALSLGGRKAEVERHA
jgi:hypothetical protein